MKQELKDLSVKLKNIKKELKESHQALSKFELNIGTQNSLYSRRSDLEDWEKLHCKLWDLQVSFLEISSDYRALHILYSLSRGKSIYDIERKNYKGYWKDVVYGYKLKKYVEKYDFQNFDVLPIKTLKSLGRIEGNGQIRLFTREEMPGYKKPGTKRRVFARKVGGKI